MAQDGYDINPTQMTATSDVAMPQDPEAESSVLSAMMISQDVLQECLIELEPDDFYIPSNRKIYLAMREMFDRNMAVDTISLADFLKSQGELERVFSAQYILTLTEEIQIRTYTDEDGDTHEYEYRILHVKLESRPISSLATELLTPEQLEMYQVYRQTLGNKPLIFGGGSTNTSDSESLDGVEFVNGTRPGNPELVELAKRQVGNVGGQPYWSWYGFNSRVEWCACFVSWCYGQMGLSEPRFAACQSQGIPWFQSHGQWGGRDYANIAPGDAIFFDWDLDGRADHVGIVIGTDGSRVYTVEGNSGDTCKIRSYDVNYECIKGYGLMNW